MRKLLEHTQSIFNEFIEQRDDLFLIASCTDADAPLALKTLGDLEQVNNTDLFLIFTDPFVQPAPYVSVLVERLREQHRVASEALIADGQAPLPAMPETLFDETRSPYERLKEGVRYSRSLLPPKGGHRLVWVMFPPEIADRSAYLKLVTPFIPWPGSPVPKGGVRIIVRDLTDTLKVAPSLARAPRTRIVPLDLGPKAMESSMQEESKDESLPEEDRMNALLSLGLLDYAHSRYIDAMTKYETLLSYYQKTGHLAMQGFVINGIGDIFHRQNALDDALYWYECAVVPASKAEAPGIFHTVVKNLGDVSFKLDRFADAEEYFTGADQLATHLLDADGRVYALEMCGKSQVMQGEFDKADTSWRTALTLCESLTMDTEKERILGHLEKLETKRGAA